MLVPGKLSKSKKANYIRLFKSLRKRKRSADDILLGDIHDKTFANTNCLECANCCKTHSPLFLQKDIERIAAYLKLTSSEFVAKYLILDEDGDWVFHSSPCPFLAVDNKCGIYEIRPNACREYPHTNRKKIYQIAEITMKNAEICPAVVSILDELKLKILNE